MKMSGPTPRVPYPCSGKVRRPPSWADRTYPSPPTLNLSLNGGGGGSRTICPQAPFPMSLLASAPATPVRSNPPYSPNPVPTDRRWGSGVGASPENRKEKEDVDVDEFEGESLRLWVSYSKIFFS